MRNFLLYTEYFQLWLDIEPTRYSDAVTIPKWRIAMHQEIYALEKGRTQKLTSLPPPPHKRALRCKWVYQIKHKADGSIECYKSQLVILGNTKKEDVDFIKTFAPIARMVSVQTLLTVASIQNQLVHQMDVHNIILHGDLEEKLYMRPPSGFFTTSSCQVY